MEVLISAFFPSQTLGRLTTIVPVIKCLGFQGEVTCYNVVVQGGILSQAIWKVLSWLLSFLLSLLVSNPARERGGGTLVGFLCPRPNI